MKMNLTKKQKQLLLIEGISSAVSMCAGSVAYLLLKKQLPELDRNLFGKATYLIGSYAIGMCVEDKVKDNVKDVVGGLVVAGDYFSDAIKKGIESGKEEEDAGGDCA